ncbi:MAG: hypothetical protein AAF674_15220 [Pseudomonadota bacterium]
MRIILSTFIWFLLLNLPAQAEMMRAHPGATVCPAQLPDPQARWTPQEHWAWHQICMGRIADMRRVDILNAKSADYDGLPCKPGAIVSAGKNVPGHRVLSSGFLTLLLAHEPWNRVAKQPTVYIQCAEIVSRLSLKNMEVRPALILRESRLLQGIDLEGAHFNRALSFEGSTVKNSFNGDWLTVGGVLCLNGDARFGVVGLKGANIVGTLDASGSRFSGSFNADGLTVGGNLLMRGALDSKTSHGGSCAELNTAAVSAIAYQSTFTRLLLEPAPGTTRGSQPDDEQNQTKARTRAKNGWGSYPKDESPNSEPNRQVVANFHRVDLSAARVDGHLQLAGSQFAGEVDLSGARLGELVLYSRRSTPKPELNGRDAIWMEGGRLTLRNMQAGALHARLDSWKHVGAQSSDAGAGESSTNGCNEKWIVVDLIGFRHERLGGSGAHDPQLMITASADQLVDWLNCVRPVRNGADDHYDPGPYEHLAAILRREGYSAKADLIEYAKYERRAAAGVHGVGVFAASHDGTPWYDREIFWPLSGWLVGYGVFPFRLLFYFAGLVGLGWVVGLFSKDPVLSSRTGRAALSRFWYSLENALPLIELSEAYKTVDHKRVWVSSIYHIQKLLGFLLATYLVGALTLLAN